MINNNAYPYSIYDFQEGGGNSLLKRADDLYANASTLNLARWGEADTDMRFLVNDQTLWNDVYGNVPSYQKSQFTFNRIKPIKNMIGGYQRKNRKSMVAVPVENSSQQTADIVSKIFFQINTSSNFNEILSTAFEAGAITTGLSLLEIGLNYEKDPINGDFFFKHVAYSGFIIDPYWTKPDLSDCTFIWQRKWVTQLQAKLLFPHQYDLISTIVPEGNRDGKFQYMAQSYNYAMQNLLALDEIWYLDDREAKMLVDTKTGETMEYDGDEESLKRFLHAYPDVKEKIMRVPTVRLGQILNGRALYDGPNPLGIDEYPFVPVFGYINNEIPYMQWRQQGVVRSLRDSQYLYNRRKVLELDILESQINSGWIYKPGSLVNPNDVFLTGQGRVFAIKDGKEMADVQKIDSPAIPPTTLEISKIMGEEILTLSGVNQELLGMAEEEIPGVLSMLRQGAGLTNLQQLFDQLDTSQKIIGERIFEIIQKKWTPQKVSRLAGVEPTPEFYNKAFGKYHIRVEEGLNTTTQRQMQFAQLLQLRQIGVPIPDDLLLQESTLQNKDALINAVAQKQAEAQQQMQQQMQMQAELQQAQAAQMRGVASANEGLGLERVSRVKENSALALERVAEAERDHQTALLEQAKAVKEVEGISIDNLVKALQILEVLKQNTLQNSIGENSIQEMAEEGTPSSVV